MNITLVSMSRCPYCWKAPDVQRLESDMWLITCDGISIASETLDRATVRWNEETGKVAGGWIA